MKVQITTGRQGSDDYLNILYRSPVRDVPGAERTLKHCLCISEEVFVGKIDDKLVCVWGLIPPTILSESAYLWLLCTDTVSDHTFVFARRSQIVMGELRKRYTLIVGNCVASDTKAIRWLKWLGAEFQYHGGPTLAFTIRSNHG